MRKITVLILIISVALFNACKNKDIETVSFKIGEERAIPTATNVVITGSYAFAGTIKGMKVSIGEKENLNDASLHDMNVEGTDFSVTVGGLKPTTEYYYRFSVDFGMNEPYLTEIKTFTTLIAAPELPKVKALDWLTIDSTTIRVKCEVISDGNQEVTERGIFWNTYGDPSTEDHKVKSTTGGLGQYTIRMGNLTQDITYHVKAYAKNAVGIALSEEELVFQLEVPQVLPVEIVLSCNPAEGGTVSGDGFYEVGSQCTVTATANTGYHFVEWTEDGSPVSSDAEYSFTVSGGRNLVANFSTEALQEFRIYAEASPEDAGTVHGSGDYIEGSECTLTVEPIEGFVFENWTEDGNNVSEEAVYTFTVTRDRSLVAHLAKVPSIDVPTGAIAGLFTINGNHDQVYFSQGNLRYRASTYTWKFADNQYDAIGEGNSNISSSYGGWIDLFGWATNGYDNGSACYQPWSTSTDNGDYYKHNLSYQGGTAEWGNNAISNGGNTPNTWRTLTHDEWVYVFNTRNTASGIRYAKAIVHGVNGIILLPDDWSDSYYTLNNHDLPDAHFFDNRINDSNWENDLLPHGVVFLPVTGYRIGTTIYEANSLGFYWSSTCNWGVSFDNDNLNPEDFNSYRCYGRPIRLVCPAQ